MKEYILVAGSRNFSDMETLEKVLNETIAPDTFFAEIVIVEGGAKGEDTMAKEYAEKRGLGVREFKPEWNKYGRAAGPKRNIVMVEFIRENGGKAVYFWDGKSKGTKKCIESARKLGVPVTIWNTTEGRYTEE